MSRTGSALDRTSRPHATTLGGFPNDARLGRSVLATCNFAQDRLPRVFAIDHSDTPTRCLKMRVPTPYRRPPCQEGLCVEATLLSAVKPGGLRDSCCGTKPVEHGNARHAAVAQNPSGAWPLCPTDAAPNRCLLRKDFHMTPPPFELGVRAPRTRHRMTMAPDVFTFGASARDTLLFPSPHVVEGEPPT